MLVWVCNQNLNENFLLIKSVTFSVQILSPASPPGGVSEWRKLQPGWFLLKPINKIRLIPLVLVLVLFQAESHKIKLIYMKTSKLHKNRKMAHLKIQFRQFIGIKQLIWDLCYYLGDKNSIFCHLLNENHFVDFDLKQETFRLISHQTGRKTEMHIFIQRM